MPNWKDLLSEVKALGGTHDVLRRKYLAKMFELTGRNVIVYYSGWLQKTGFQAVEFSVNDADKTGFMSAIHKLDRSKGLDLVLHTPGGSIAATESIVEYLRSMFGRNIRAIVPELAMSAGTVIACACREIVMGKHSSLGPIDPQVNGMPAHGVIEEFDTAREEVKGHGDVGVALWQPIIAKYAPTLIGQCRKAIDWTNKMTKEWLSSGMFSGDPEAEFKASEVVKKLGSHAHMKSHGRHISADSAKQLGLKIFQLEEDGALQEAVLSVHHACIHTLGYSTAVKIIENHDGHAFIQQRVAVSQQSGMALQSE